MSPQIKSYQDRNGPIISPATYLALLAPTLAIQRSHRNNHNCVALRSECAARSNHPPAPHCPSSSVSISGDAQCLFFK